MHIPDGFLTNRIAGSLDVVSGATILYASRRVRVDFSGRMVPVMGVLAAFVFAAQMLNFPILGGTSGHLVGGALLAILLGPMAGFLTMSTVVIAQALFLQDGGLVALGANVFNICAVTCFSGYAIFRFLGGGSSGGKRLFLIGFISAWASLLFSSACCALEIGISGAIPLRIGLSTMVGYHMVVGIIEGMLTAGVLHLSVQGASGLNEDQRARPLWTRGLGWLRRFGRYSICDFGVGRKFQAPRPTGKASRGFATAPDRRRSGKAVFEHTVYGLLDPGCCFCRSDWPRNSRRFPGQAQEQEQPAMRHNFIDRYAALDSPLHVLEPRTKLLGFTALVVAVLCIPLDKGRCLLRISSPLPS